MPNLQKMSEIHALIIDDSAVVLNMLSAVLFSIGIKKVTSADSLQSAKALIPRLDRCPFDIVFLDRYLGNEDGFEILKAIRNQDKTVPIIMVTQENKISKIKEAIQLGATDYVVKPFNESIIAEKLKLIFG